MAEHGKSLRAAASLHSRLRLTLPTNPQEQYQAHLYVGPKRVDFLPQISMLKILTYE